MNPPRERSAIVAAWLEEGPNELPESTRRAIAVDVRTTHQSRRSVRAPRWFPRLDRLSLVAVAAVAVMALAVGGLVVRPFASGGSNVGGLPPSPSEAPPSPRCDDLGLPADAGPVMSPNGMAIRSRIPRTGPWPARLIQEGGGRHRDWRDGSSTSDPFDYIEGPTMRPRFRAASALLPADLRM